MQQKSKTEQICNNHAAKQMFDGKKDYNMLDVVYKKRSKQTYIFDVDGTLVGWKSREVLPNVREWFDKNKHMCNIGFATNQGGVIMGYHTESEAKIMVFRAIAEATGIITPRVRMAFAYQDKKSGKWAKTPPEKAHKTEWRHSWRKPSPVMIYSLMGEFESNQEDTTYVGDMESDRLAAENAGVNFIWAKDMFGWDD